MAKREKTIVERKFYLDSKQGTVEVIVRGPAGAVKLTSTETAISIATGDAPPAIVTIAAGPGPVGADGVATNKQLSAEGEKMLQSLRTRAVEEHKKQQVTAGEKQQALLDSIGAGNLIEELQVLATPDA